MNFALVVILLALAGIACGAMVAAFGLPMAYLLLAGLGGGIVLWGSTNGSI